jgi:hypothetical protein
MTTITPNGRLLAIVAGGAFVYGGLRIILGEALTDPSQWTTSVQLTVLTVFGTIAAGHLLNDARIAKHWLAMIGFGVLFVSGTGLVVYNSVGRQAEGTMMTEAQMVDVADRKAGLKAELTTNTGMLKTARERLGKECDTGDGTACKGKRATVKVYEDAVAGIEAKIAALGPLKPVHAKSTEMAKVAAVFGADEAKAKVALMLTEPFFTTLFFEIGAIVSLGFAFRRQPVAAQPTLKQAITEQPQGFPTDDEIEQLRRLLLKKNAPLSNNDVKRALGCSKGEASKRVAKAVAAGVLTKVPNGREVRLQLANRTLN